MGERPPCSLQFRHDDVAMCWRVTFRPRGSDIALPRLLHFGDAEKLRTMFQRFATRRMAEDVAALEFGIRVGRGAVELLLGEQELRKLRTAKSPSLRSV